MGNGSPVLVFFLFKGAQTRWSLYLKCPAVVLGDVRRCGDECPLMPGLKQAPKLFSPKLQGRSKAWLLAEKSAKSVTGGDSWVQWVPCCLNSRAEQLVLKQEKAAEPNQTAPNFSLLSLRRSGGKIFLHPNPSGAGAVGKTSPISVVLEELSQTLLDPAAGTWISCTRVLVRAARLICSS